MATLRIYNDIVDEEDQILLRTNGEGDGVCYKDIQEFLDKIPEDDNLVDVRIHCKGGNCGEGWTMYDALRRCGKTISVTVEGECSSIATIILLAAPAERRCATKNSRFCLHNPALQYLDADNYSRLTPDNIDKLVENLEIQGKALRDEQDRILDLYVERTGGNRKALQSLMDKDTYINAERAQELGFISSILVPTTASKRNHRKTKSINKNMAKPKIKKCNAPKQSAFARFLAKVGVASMVAQVVTAANGDELTVERNEGDPQVGDTAYPDGNFVLDDGTTIVVENEVIADIIEPGAGDPTEENDPLALVEDPEEIRALIAELQAKLAELDPEAPAEEEKVAELEEKVAELEQTVEEQTVELRKARPIVAKVEKAGGMTWLNGVMGMKSTYTANNRRFVPSAQAGCTAEPESKTAKRLREKREAAEAKRKARIANK